VFSSNKVLVFNLGFDRKGPRDVHWMYFPIAPSCSTGSAGTTTSCRRNPDAPDRMSLYVEIGAASDTALDVDTLRARVLGDLRREGIVTDHRLISHHHVVLDPAYVHITQASLAETARLRAELGRAALSRSGCPRSNNRFQPP